MVSAYKMPEKIRRKIEQKAPSVTISENSGRRYGDFTEYDIDSRGYQNIIFYIQKGLSSYSKLIEGILKPILKMQGDPGIKYRIIPFTFGIADEPFYKGRYFDLRYSFYNTNILKIIKILAELSGDGKSQNQSIIPLLFTKSNIGGKRRIKKNEDLLIIIGQKDQVYFDESIREEVEKFRKQILFVEIENENVNWYFHNYQPRYLKKKQGVKKMKRRLDATAIHNLKKSNLWNNEIAQDCKDQNVLFTIRDNRIDLYHKGGKLFGFENNEFKTHIKYAAVIKKNKKDYLTESELSNYRLAHNFEANYRRIKENCKNFAGIEASGVSSLYHKHSYLSDSNIVVLDIEVSFESINQENNQDRIDILLYNKTTRTLQFVEAKHYSNKEIWSKTTPKVIGQIKRYESQIKQNKSLILKEYIEYVKIVKSIFGISIPEPVAIEDKVTLLIFGFDQDQKKGRLKTLIINNKNKAYSGIKNYSIGDIKKIIPGNLWNAKVL